MVITKIAVSDIKSASREQLQVLLLGIPADDAAYRAYLQRREERVVMKIRELPTLQRSLATTDTTYSMQDDIYTQMFPELTTDPRDFPFKSCRDLSDVVTAFLSASGEPFWVFMHYITSYHRNHEYPLSELCQIKLIPKTTQWYFKIAYNFIIQFLNFTY